MKTKKDYYTNLLKPYTDKLMCSREIAKITGLKQKHIQKLLKKYDLPRQKQGDASQLSKNHFWKGGKIIDKSGYVLLKDNSHPFCNSGGYVREQRLVMEKHLGRYLTATEVVHHKNKIRNDNRIENLELFETNGIHLKEELTGNVPKWSVQGKENILKAVHQQKVKKVLSNQI